MEPQTQVTHPHLATDLMVHLAVVVDQPTTELLLMEDQEVQHTSQVVEVEVVETVTVVTEPSDKVDLDTTTVVKVLTQVSSKQQMVENQMVHLAVLVVTSVLEDGTQEVVEDSQEAVAVLRVTATTLQTHLVDKVVTDWL
tara:strand:+ start:347 stop:766 length:420 start_codon:yes stop_codon:yes gene_type:complete